MGATSLNPFKNATAFFKKVIRTASLQWKYDGLYYGFGTSQKEVNDYFAFCGKFADVMSKLGYNRDRVLQCCMEHGYARQCNLLSLMPFPGEMKEWGSGIAARYVEVQIITHKDEVSLFPETLVARRFIIVAEALRSL